MNKEEITKHLKDNLVVPGPEEQTRIISDDEIAKLTRQRVADYCCTRDDISSEEVIAFKEDAVKAIIGFKGTFLEVYEVLDIIISDFLNFCKQDKAVWLLRVTINMTPFMRMASKFNRLMYPNGNSIMMGCHADEEDIGIFLGKPHHIINFTQHISECYDGPEIDMPTFQHTRMENGNLVGKTSKEDLTNIYHYLAKCKKDGNYPSILKGRH